MPARLRYAGIRFFGDHRRPWSVLVTRCGHLRYLRNNPTMPSRRRATRAQNRPVARARFTKDSVGKASGDGCEREASCQISATAGAAGCRLKFFAKFIRWLDAGKSVLGSSHTSHGPASPCVIRYDGLDSGLRDLARHSSPETKLMYKVGRRKAAADRDRTFLGAMERVVCVKFSKKVIGYASQWSRGARSGALSESSAQRPRRG
jgi:hypothetical protein